jgi:predicted RNA binding protein YcfA (HicA-like mRNA interferase family)
MKCYSSREVIKLLMADGWYHVQTTGDHWQFKHPSKPGRVTVPHPEKNIPAGTLKNISKQSGINFD